ncbi:TPA: 30S ribosomal protein S18 [Candidatus Acetothermia bacterium]|nr:30S ribosomal protein S18 [Candidatus Acetothermia bacterium]
MQRQRRVCRVCDQGLKLRYTDVETLRPFVNRRGKILSRRVSRLCAKHQNLMATEIDRARKLALLPYEDKP